MKMTTLILFAALSAAAACTDKAPAVGSTNSVIVDSGVTALAALPEGEARLSVEGGKIW